MHYSFSPISPFSTRLMFSSGQMPSMTFDNQFQNGFFPQQASGGQPQFSSMFDMQAILTQFLQGFLVAQLLKSVLGSQKNNAVSPTPQPTPQPDSQPNLIPLKVDKDDFVDYFLAGSRGGTTSTVEVIEGRYARPNSRFANAGANEFDAMTAYAYAGQFKAYALGLDVVYNPGDNTNQLSDNLAKAIQTPFTSEAEVLSKVAAVYRGDLTGVNAYNNGALKGLLLEWGRQDLANQPGVGITDVESIGGVVRALNEQTNSTTRQSWLQQVFDFKDNTANSPSGAVPNLSQYQDAINIVRGGRLDELLNNYRQGIKTGDSNSGTLPGTVRAIPTA